jgi:hypothetical protein
MSYHEFILWIIVFVMCNKFIITSSRLYQFSLGIDVHRAGARMMHIATRHNVEPSHSHRMPVSYSAVAVRSA